MKDSCKKSINYGNSSCRKPGLELLQLFPLVSPPGTTSQFIFFNVLAFAPCSLGKVGFVASYSSFTMKLQPVLGGHEAPW